jgi:hypothetical protein
VSWSAGRRIGDVLLRSLDAIHLATAASIAVALGHAPTTTEGRALGLPVVTPT